MSFVTSSFKMAILPSFSMIVCFARIHPFSNQNGVLCFFGYQFGLSLPRHNSCKKKSLDRREHLDTSTTPNKNQPQKRSENRKKKCFPCNSISGSLGTPKFTFLEHCTCPNGSDQVSLYFGLKIVVSLPLLH